MCWEFFHKQIKDREVRFAESKRSASYDSSRQFLFSVHIERSKLSNLKCLLQTLGLLRLRVQWALVVSPNVRIGRRWWVAEDRLSNDLQIISGGMSKSINQ